MQHVNINLLDLVILDGVEYRLASHEPEGIVLIGTAPPHPARSISHGELGELLRSPRFRCIPGGAARTAAERNLDGLPEYFRDLPEDKQQTALWRLLFAEELLRHIEAGLARRNEASVNAILPAIIAAVESHIRKRFRKRFKRAGRMETFRTPPCAKSLLTWARAYERSGFNIMALVPQTHRCGVRRQMLPGELAAFDALIEEYASPLRPTIDQIQERATNLYADFNRDRAERGLPELRPPSRSTVYRAILRMDPYETYLQRWAGSGHSLRQVQRKVSSRPRNRQQATVPNLAGGSPCWFRVTLPYIKPSLFQKFHGFKDPAIFDFSRPVATIDCIGQAVDEAQSG